MIHSQKVCDCRRPSAARRGDSPVRPAGCPVLRGPMKIHEYQGKGKLRHGKSWRARPAAFRRSRSSGEGGPELGRSGLGGSRRRSTRGRGKGGGVKLARSDGRGAQRCRPDPGHAAGHAPDRPPRPEGAPVADRRTAPTSAREYYVSVVTDRATQKVALMAQSEGGMDIEEVAPTRPRRSQGVRRSATGLTTRRAKNWPRHWRAGGIRAAVRGCVRQEKLLPLLHGHGTRRWSKSTR